VIPLGTGNNFFRDIEHMHIPEGGTEHGKHTFKFDPLEAARWIAAGNMLPLDAARVDHATEGGGKATTYSINCVGWGLVATAAKRAEKLRMFGALRYDVGGLAEVFENKSRPATLTAIDGNGQECPMKGNFSFLLLQMTVCSGSAMPFTPFSLLDNGKFDVIIAPRAGRITGLTFFDKLKKHGTHIYMPQVKYVRLTGLAVNPQEESVLMVDGEFPGVTPWRAVTERGCWHTFVPPPPK
jgi:diacylglycerol kinase family enzyme